MNCSDTYQADAPALRVLQRVEEKIGRGLLIHLYFAFRDERLNNHVAAKRYKISLFDVVQLREHPWVVLNHLTSDSELLTTSADFTERKPSTAVILLFRQSA